MTHFVVVIANFSDIFHTIQEPEKLYNRFFALKALIRYEMNLLKLDTIQRGETAPVT